MSIYVHIADVCLQEASTLGFAAEIDKLKNKLEAEQSKGGLIKYPPPFFVKKFGKSGRLVIEEKYLDGNCLICFLRFFTRSDPKYHREFLENPEKFHSDNAPSDGLCRKYLLERTKTPIIPLPDPSEKENLYLLSLKESARSNEISILESDEWVTRIQDPAYKNYLSFYWKAIFNILEKHPDPSINTAVFENREILYKYYPEHNKLFLVAPIDPKTSNDKNYLIGKYPSIFDDSEPLSETDLLRQSRRSYPSIVLYDDSIWIGRIQESTTANMALSPEELAILEEVFHHYQADKKAYPIFINGRPGSGKSTVLQYLFTEYLYFHLSLPAEERLQFPPIYLTYNDSLLLRAKETIEDILKCDSKKVIRQALNLRNSEIRNEFERAFGDFHNFLFSLLPQEFQARFQRDRYINFSKFRDFWNDKYSKSPNAEIRQLSPELAWHVIRTFIKGMRQDNETYFDVDSYSLELPRSQKTVTEDNFSLIYSLWEKYYRPLCEDEGYWDDQDLTWCILSMDQIDLSKYPVVFCDESQDFTHLELNLIYKLSLFSRRKVPPYLLGLIPFAFAGDPFQTLNPTGFNWDSIRANFHNMIIRQMEMDESIDLEFVFKELGYNYRSMTSIVNFCNLIQLLRGIAFNIKRLVPQKSWFSSPSSLPVYFEDQDLNGQALIQEQKEIVIIVPCQEGEETEYCKSDEFLRRIVFDQDGNIARNVQSPIRAKGLEFRRVVLYKFGEQCIADYPGLINLIDSDDRNRALDDETLPFEYFINRLYVAASRPQRRLFIIDTKNSIEIFWKYFKDIDLASLLLRYPNDGAWTINDLGQIQLGTPDNVGEDRDDPKALAEKFFEDGKSNRSIYQLILAKNNYLAIEPPALAKAELCQALIYEFENKYKEAGDVYLKLNDWKKAKDLYWRAQAFADLIHLGQKDSRLRNSLEHQAATYITGQKSPILSVQFLADLRSSAIEDGIVLHQLCTDDSWSKVFSEIIKYAYSNQAASKTIDWVKFFNDLAYFCDSGLSVENSLEYSWIAYKANLFEKAIDIWNNIKPAIIDQPKWIIESRGETAAYPEKLKWLYQLKDHPRIIAEYEANLNEKISAKELEWIFESLLHEKKLDLILRFLKDHPEENRFGRAMEITLSMDNQDDLKIISEYYLQHMFGSRNWNAAHEFVNGARMAGMNKQFSNKVESSGLDKNLRFSIYLRLMAHATKITANNPRQISDFLNNNLIRNKNQELAKVISPSLAGAAVEKTGFVIDSLRFYEGVIAGNWGNELNIINDAKERWIKSKRWQIDRASEDNKKRLSDELYLKLSDWRISESDFVLSPGYGEISFQSTKVKEELSSKQNDATEVVFEHHLGGSSTEDVKKPLEYQLKDKMPVYSVTSKVKVGSIEYTFRLSQKRKKLEISDSKFENLVTAYTDHCEATNLKDSDVIAQRTRGDQSIWEVKGWNINITTQQFASFTLIGIEEKESENEIMSFKIK